MFIDYQERPAEYALIYSNLKLTGTKFLAFRDLPELLKKYCKGFNALDYGCGAGSSTIFLKNLGLKVTGVDINPDMLKSAILNDPQGEYRLIKSAEIPANDNTYDLVFSSFALLEVSTLEEIKNILKEIYRALKKGGIFMTILCIEDFYNMDWLTINSEFEENKELISGKRVKLVFKNIDLAIYDYYWSNEDFQNAIQTSGLTLIDTHKPLGKDDDGYAWVNEKHKSPYIIYITRKDS
jgi:ubiquinone/menaquinone biosynthesis C-methylase UbiE